MIKSNDFNKEKQYFFFKFYHDNKCFIKINLIIIILIILLIFEVIFYVIMRNTKTDIIITKLFLKEILILIKILIMFIIKMILYQKKL